MTNPFNKDVLDDAVSHREAWEKIFDSAQESMSCEDDKSHIEHEKRALLRLLNAVENLGWFASIQYDDGNCELFVRPNGLQAVSGAGANNEDAACALAPILAECLDGTLED